MGCDIHFYVERKVDDRWLSVNNFDVEIEEDDEAPGGKREYLHCNDEWYRERNYKLFAILANVRNGWGGDEFKPISMPKGLPDDCDPRIKRLSDQLGVDGHSHSWHTLADLLAYDWTQTTKLRGWINGPEFEKWDCWDRHDGEGPDSYCGSVSGPMIEYVSAAELELRVKALKKEYAERGDLRSHWWPEFEQALREQLGQTYAQVEWEQPYYKCARFFWSDTIPRLLRLARSEGLSYSDVRIVFWFDN